MNERTTSYATRIWSLARAYARLAVCGLVLLVPPALSSATQANRIAMERYYGRFLPKNLAACTTCHLPLAAGKSPDSLLDFPHNAFGRRLAAMGEQLRKRRLRADIPTRLRMVANEDSDGDGADNLTEILAGRSPGDKADAPTPDERKRTAARKAEFARFLASYRWRPFESVQRPAIPKPKDAAWAANPIDSFLAADREKRGVRPRPPASRIVLLRRVTLDLTGLSPTPAEITAYLSDTSPNAYEKVVDRLLASPRYGERWARHWMDIWRYSDWAGWADGNQIRDSKPFIWRWRDWIVESLNADKGYDAMLQEMLAADELHPEDPNSLRATGFLVRNFKLLSREQWLEDTVNHTSRAFLGLTMHCAKCHNHMYDPITQADYYRMRAIFEPHNVRTDRLPGQPDVTKDGLVRAFDAEPDAPTYLFVRGDERNPDKSRSIEPGVPASLGGTLDVAPIKLPAHASSPDRRPFVIQETRAAGLKAVSDAEAALQAADSLPASSPARLRLQRKLDVARARNAALTAVLAIEELEEAGKKGSPDWDSAARAALSAQRREARLEAEAALFDARAALEEARLEAEAALFDARAALEEARGKAADAAAATAAREKAATAVTAAVAQVAAAEKTLGAARAAESAPVTTAYTPRPLTVYPATSTGRRLAFAKWLTDAANPLAARVAVNHIWARHFGQGLVPSVSDFGHNGQPPTHPELLDWLASQFMSGRWRMKDLHRLIVTSRTYRLASTPDAADAKIDPDDALLWRFPSRRLEAEAVRDNVLFVAGHLDETAGGPEIDHTLALTSRRRSIYFQTAAEKQAELIQVFDGPSVTECYERRPSVMPQQALALANSELTQRESRLLAADLTKLVGDDDERFVTAAFLRVLARSATAAERSVCRAFLGEHARKPAATAAAAPGQIGDPRQRARWNLVLVLFNHNDFVTVR
jgi:hypothetical protein